MNNAIWVPVKVLPGKKALDVFVQKWKEAGAVPFNGEFSPPEDRSPGRLMSIDPSQISHIVEDINMDTYDGQKRTVMVKCRMCGPHGSEAIDKFIRKDLRFTTRTVRGKDTETGEIVDRIVTFDCVQNPGKKFISDLKTKYCDEDQAKADIAKFLRKRDQ